MRLLAPVGVLLFLCFLLVLPYWQQRARKRFLATIQAMAEKGRSEIDGHPIEHWLNILNQDGKWPVVVADSMVLKYERREWFFVDGWIAYTPAKGFYGLEKGFFLVAIGRAAVELLSEQERVFRRISGSAELAVFSIYRWSDFTYLLTAETKL
jgi:hypothetical protein